jgi:hypothetical protein
MHKKHHGAAHHRKAEMEHHAIRNSHKAAHHAAHPKMHEHGSKVSPKSHSSMIDNRHVNDNHQQGISRVLQRKGDMEVGQHGKMGMGHHEGSFKRATGKSVPTRG